MNMTWNTMRHPLFITLAFSVFSLATAGCSMFRATPEPVVEAEPQPAPEPLPEPPREPTMGTTGDVQLTLFGELPEHPRLPYNAQASTPMIQHSFTSEGADFDVDISPDGKWMVFCSTRHFERPDIYLKMVNGRAVTQLTSDPASDVQPCFSPDGKRVVFASDRSGNWDLWIKSIERGQATQITDSPQHEVHPSFSPDGTRLVYCLFNEKSDQWELWTLLLGEPGSKRMIGIGLFPEWSPVEDSIVYQKARQRGGRWFSVWRIDLQLGEPKFPIELAASADKAYIQPSWSPDGKWVTFSTAEVAAAGGSPHAQSAAASGEVWIIRSDGTDNLQLSDTGGANFSPCWSPEGRVYFTSLQNGAENIWSVKPLINEALQMPPLNDGGTAENAVEEGFFGPGGTQQGG